MRISNETKVGILATLSIVLLILGFNFLRSKNIFSNDKIIYVQVKDANGLLIGGLVKINGFQIGMIEDINLMVSRDLLIKISMQENLKIPKNSEAQIVSSSLIGDRIITIFLGDDSTGFLNNMDTILGTNEQPLTDKALQEITPIKEQLLITMINLDSVLISMRTVLNDQNKQQLSSSLSTANTTLNTFNAMASKMNNMLDLEHKKLSNILNNVFSITENFRKTNDEIQKIIANTLTTTENAVNVTNDVKQIDFKNIINTSKDNVNTTLQTTDQTMKTAALTMLHIHTILDNANQTLTNFKIISDKIVQGEGSLGLLLNDKKLYENLEQTSLDLDKLLIDIKNHPQKFVHFSLFGKKIKP